MNVTYFLISVIANINNMAIFPTKPPEIVFWEHHPVLNILYTYHNVWQKSGDDSLLSLINGVNFIQKSD